MHNIGFKSTKWGCVEPFRECIPYVCSVWNKWHLCEQRVGGEGTVYHIVGKDWVSVRQCLEESNRPLYNLHMEDCSLLDSIEGILTIYIQQFLVTSIPPSSDHLHSKFLHIFNHFYLFMCGGIPNWAHVFEMWSHHCQVQLQ